MHQASNYNGQEFNQECKFCKRLTARPIQNSIPNQQAYYCGNCRHTYTVVIGDDMGRKKKNKNKNKNKQSQAVVNQKIINKATAADDSWEVKIDCVEDCSKAPENVTIWFHPLAKRKVDTLMKEYADIEWLAYLLGDKETKEVKDIFIPDQSISSVRVDDIECDEFNNIPVIGVVHSHHNMGHSFSGTDHDYINGNHDISIVISHTGLAGQYRYKTPCNAYKIVDANVRLKVEIEFNDEEFIESVKPKLTKKTYTTYHYPGNYGGYGYDQWPTKPGASWQDKSTVKPKEEKDDFDTGDFLTEEELTQLNLEVEELDFTKELSLAEELELLEEINDPDDKQDM